MSEPLSRHVMAAILLSLAVCVASCQGNTAQRGSTAEPDSTASAGSSTAPSPTKPVKAAINAQSAANKALAALPGSAVVELDRSQESGRAAWEVVVRKPDGSGIELYIDESTGDLLKQESADVPSHARASAPTITAIAAMSAALAATPGTVEEVGLEREDGATVWEVRVAGASGRVEHYIDANSGIILKRQPK